MGIHVEVHSRSYKHGRLHREICGDEHIVCHAVRHLAERARRAWRYGHCVSPQSEVDVRVPCAVALREELADNGLMRECGERNRSDELLACRRNHDLHFCALLHKLAYEQTRLVGSD